MRFGNPVCATEFCFLELALSFLLKYILSALPPLPKGEREQERASERQRRGIGIENLEARELAQLLARPVTEAERISWFEPPLFPQRKEWLLPIPYRLRVDARFSIRKKHAKNAYHIWYEMVYKRYENERWNPPRLACAWAQCTRTGRYI